MQFHSYTAATNKLEREAHQRLLAAPRFTFTTAFLAHAKKCHLPYALHVLPVNGKAAQYRFAVSTSKIFFKCEALLRGIQHFTVGDEMCSEYRINPIANDWWYNSVMGQMIRTVTEVHSIAPQLEGKDPKPQLQRDTAQLLLERSGFELPVTTFVRRLCRFVQPHIAESIQIQKVLDTVASAKHPFLTASMVKTVLNGWCTSRRFQLTVLPCFFGCGRAHADELEHYRCCPVLWAFLRQHAPYIYYDQHHDPDNYNDDSTLMLFGLHAPPDKHHTLTAAIFLHTFFVTYENLRTHQQRSRVNDYTNKTGMLTTTLHFTLTNHPDLHNTIAATAPSSCHHNQLGHHRP